MEDGRTKAPFPAAGRDGQLMEPAFDADGRKHGHLATWSGTVCCLNMKTTLN